MTQQQGPVNAIADVRSDKIRMYLKASQAVMEAKQALLRAQAEAKVRRAKLSGGEWAAAQRWGKELGLEEGLV